MPDPRITFILDAKNLSQKEFAKVRKDLTGVQADAEKAGGGVGGFASALGGSRVAMLGAGLGAGALVLGLRGAAEAAMEEEKGIGRMNTALLANASGWDGNLDSVEKNIRSRERLAFTDDSLRDSLGALIVKTKDVARAQDLQSIAMDLARARDIDLGEATDALIKIQNGQYRALKGLGIAIEPVTTAQDALRASTTHYTTAQMDAAKATDDAATKAKALAAIQKATAGQSEKYAKSAAGEWETTGIIFGDVVEDIGALMLPAVKAFGETLRDALDPAGVSFERIESAASRGSQAAQARLRAIQAEAVNTAAILDAAGVDVDRIMAEESTKIYDNVEAMRALRLTAKTELAPALEDVASTTADVRSEFQKTTDAARDLDSAVSDLSGALYDADVTAGDLAKAKKDLDAILKDGPESKSAADVAIWHGQLAEAQKRVFDLQFQMAQLEGPQAMRKWLEDQRLALKDADQATQDYLWHLRAVALLAGTVAPATDSVRLGGSTVPGAPRARGGSVVGGEPYIVGERGPELFVPRQSGSIVPNGDGGAVNVNVSLSGAAIFDPYGVGAQQIAQALLPGLRRELSRQGMSLG